MQEAPVVREALIETAPVAPVMAEPVYTAPVVAPMAEEPVSVQAAVDPEVTIRTITPPPSIFLTELAPVMKPEPQPLPQAFIPPAPERPTLAPRMPTINELPPQVQRQIAESKGEVSPQADERRGGFFERLKVFGARKDETGAAHQEPSFAPVSAPVPAAPQAHRPVQQVAEPARRQANPEPVARPRQAGLDATGRPMPQMSEDDHLEIPAFLRRQSH
jgi:cell division protein FtsZ